MRYASRLLTALLLAAPALSALPASLSRAGTEIPVTGANGHLPAVAMNGTGGFVVVWQTSGTPGISGQRFDATGSPLGAAFAVNVATGTFIGGADVGIDSNGNFVVAWVQDSDVAARRFSSAGAALTSQFRVNSETSYTPLALSVAASGTGAFVVTWSGLSGRSLVFGQRFDASGSAAGGEFRVDASTLGNQTAPAAAVDGAGNFALVWSDSVSDGSSAGILGQRYHGDGTPAGSRFLVNTYTTGKQLNPRVAADAAGDFVVVWQSAGEDGDGYGVFGQRFGASGSPMGGEFPVNSYTTGAQKAPAVAVDGAGNFVVVWQVVSAGVNDIHGQRYAATGAPLGPEFRATPDAASTELTPRVGISSSGLRAVVAWERSGVAAQRYALSGDVNLDDKVDVSDVFFLINALFAGGAQPPGPADANGDALVDVADVFYLINYLFAGGPAPR